MYLLQYFVWRFQMRNTDPLLSSWLISVVILEKLLRSFKHRLTINVPGCRQFPGIRPEVAQYHFKMIKDHFNTYEHIHKKNVKILYKPELYSFPETIDVIYK